MEEGSSELFDLRPSAIDQDSGVALEHGAWYWLLRGSTPMAYYGSCGLSRPLCLPPRFGVILMMRHTGHCSCRSSYAPRKDRSFRVEPACGSSVGQRRGEESAEVSA